MLLTTSASSWPQFAWFFTPPLEILIALSLVMTWWSWQRRERHRWAGLSGGILVFALLDASDVQRLSMVSYRCHMLDHLIIVLIVAPLCSVAITWPVSRRGAGVGFLALTALIPLYHLTRLGGYVMTRSGGHVIEELSFLIIGTWFWWPIYGQNSPLSTTHKLIYVACATPILATTGLVLWSSTNAMARMGMTASQMPMTDVREGGIVMMIVGTAGMTAHFVQLALSQIYRYWRSHQKVWPSLVGDTAN